MEPLDLLKCIEQHLAANDLSETEFGWKALRDPNFIRDLRAGREPRRKTVGRVLDFMGVRIAA